jgi:hypothetical protein
MFTGWAFWTPLDATRHLLPALYKASKTPNQHTFPAFYRIRTHHLKNYKCPRPDRTVSGNWIKRKYETVKGFNDGALHLILLLFWTKSIVQYTKMKPRRFMGWLCLQGHSQPMKRRNFEIGIIPF